ncbi:hypothetical protein [Methanolapillus millepedarum]|uniref:hypothetical protein n=1 Tax=Methanolapillus millepedarum TaxID=3028296 RepID=UPI0030B8ED61
MTKRIQLLLPDKSSDGVDSLVSEGYFRNRQDAICYFVKIGLDNFGSDEKPIEVLE